MDIIIGFALMVLLTGILLLAIFSIIDWGIIDWLICLIIVLIIILIVKNLISAIKLIYGTIKNIDDSSENNS